MIRRTSDPINGAIVRMITMWNGMSPSAKAAWQVRADASNSAVAVRTELERQLQDVERQLRNVSVLPAPHPARSLEAGLEQQARDLRLAIDAVVIPSAPWAGIIQQAIADMWARR